MQCVNVYYCVGVKKHNKCCRRHVWRSPWVKLGQFDTIFRAQRQADRPLPLPLPFSSSSLSLSISALFSPSSFLPPLSSHSLCDAIRMIARVSLPLPAAAVDQVSLFAFRVAARARGACGLTCKVALTLYNDYRIDWQHARLQIPLFGTVSEYPMDISKCWRSNDIVLSARIQFLRLRGLLQKNGRSWTKSVNYQTKSRNLTLNPLLRAAQRLPSSCGGGMAAVPSSEICCFHRRGGVLVLRSRRRRCRCCSREGEGAYMGTESKSYVWFGLL